MSLYTPWAAQSLRTRPKAVAQSWLVFHSEGVLRPSGGTSQRERSQVIPREAKPEMPRAGKEEEMSSTRQATES